MGAMRQVGRRGRRSGRGLLAMAGLVAAGGCVGTTARAVLEAVWPAGPGAWPWTTFAINVVGSFVLGLLLESLVRSTLAESMQRRIRLLLGTGVLGGFTTYSTFVVEIERRLADGLLLVGLGYAVVSVVLGIAAAAAGIHLASRRRPTDRGVAG